MPKASGPRLRVAVDARLVSGEFGGVEQVIIGLAKGLSALEMGDEEYSFLTFTGETEWLAPFVSRACRLLEVPNPLIVQPWKRHLVRLFPRAADLRRRLIRRTALAGEKCAAIPLSDMQFNYFEYTVIGFRPVPQ